MIPRPGVINKDGTALAPEQVTRVLAAVTGKHPDHSRAFCYFPHNAIIFYNAAKKPVAFVEICFACLGYRAQPKGSSDNYDIVALAQIFDDLHLSMGDLPDRDAFEKHRQRFSK